MNVYLCTSRKLTCLIFDLQLFDLQQVTDGYYS